MIVLILNVSSLCIIKSNSLVIDSTTTDKEIAVSNHIVDIKVYSDSMILVRIIDCNFNFQMTKKVASSMI